MAENPNAVKAPPETPKAEEKPEAASAAPGKGGGKQTLLGILLLVGLIIGSASAAVVVASIVIRPVAATPAQAGPESTEAAAPEPAQGEKAAKEKPACELALTEPMIVNVYQTQQRRYLSVKPVFVVSNDEVLSRLKAKQVELQHVLIGMLKAKTLEQLDDPDAPNVIGREILETANLKLGLDNGITMVYFTQFVVQ